MSLFTNYTRGEVVKDYTLLPLGKHRVIVDEVALTNDRQISFRDGRMKAEEDLPEWKDVLIQLAVKFKKIDPETGKPLGVMTQRYNDHGFVRFEELPEAERAGHFAAGDDGYAVNETTGERIVCPERTAQCENIVNELFAAAGVPVGTQGTTAIVGKELEISIEEKMYKGKARTYVAKPRAITPQVAESVTSESKPY